MNCIEQADVYGKISRRNYPTKPTPGEEVSTVAKAIATIVANWQKGMQGASAAYVQGTGAVQQSPMAAAAQQAPKAMANYNASLQSGAWAAKLNSVPISFWKSQCAAAAQKLQMGATKGTPKYQAAITALIPTYAAMKQAAQANGGTPGQKAAAAIDVLVAAGKKGKALGM
jgi:hypothetical protein